MKNKNTHNPPGRAARQHHPFAKALLEVPAEAGAGWVKAFTGYKQKKEAA